MDTSNDQTGKTIGAGSSGPPRAAAAPGRRCANVLPPHKRLGSLSKVLSAFGLLVIGIIGAAVLWFVWWTAPHTLKWREEVALHDGGIITVSRMVVLVPGPEMGQRIERERRLTFRQPTTGETIVWENEGKLGSRLLPILLDFDQGQTYLVTMAQSVADYDDLGCPTPPYLVYRYAASGWTRIPLAELPARFEKANLLKYVDADLIKRSKYFLTASQIDAAYSEARATSDTRHHAIVDRRIRNPLGLGCDRWAVERAYGVEKYTEWLWTGTWLDKSEEEVSRLLGKKGEVAKP